MSEVVFEEPATMISAGDLQGFVPFGRDHCRNHPTAFNLQLQEVSLHERLQVPPVCLPVCLLVCLSVGLSA